MKDTENVNISNYSNEGQIRRHVEKTQKKISVNVYLLCM